MKKIDTCKVQKLKKKFISVFTNYKYKIIEWESLYTLHINTIRTNGVGSLRTEKS